METILARKRNELIKEGLNYIDSWEKKYNQKDYPDIYKKYQDEKLDVMTLDKTSEWKKYMNFLNRIKILVGEDNSFNDMINEIENYINKFKPKVFLERGNLEEIRYNLLAIYRVNNEMNNEMNNFYSVCGKFLEIENNLLTLR